MPKQIAQPRPAPAARPGPSGKHVFSTKEQFIFNAEADALAASLGWSGPDDNELNGIRVADAQGYLRQKFHEIHQSALTPERDTPEAAELCEHLGVTDADEVKLVVDAVKNAYDRELAEAPANPTALPAGRVANMSAKLEADVSSLVGGLGKGRK